MHMTVSPKRLIALVLAVLMTAVCAACGTNTPDATSTTPPVTNPPASTANAATAAPQSTAPVVESNINEPGMLPIVKEKIELKILTAANSTIEDFNTNYMTELVEQNTNIDLTFEVVMEEFPQKLGLMVAAGGAELPDIIFGGIAANDRAVYGQEGAILALNDYYDTHAYHMREAWEDCDMPFEQAMKYSTSYDGNIYGVMGITESLNNEHASNRMIVYMPWLEKLGLSIPQSTDELTTMLRAFRDDDPNGNGKADEIPLTGYLQALANTKRYLMSPFVYMQDRYQYLDNGKVSFAFEQEGWREGTRFVKQLLDDGLLDPLFLTQDQNSMTAMMTQEESVVGAAIRISSTNMPATDAKRYQFYNTPSIAGPDGTRQASWHPTLPSVNFFITKNCQEVEAAFLLGSYLCTKDMTMLTRFGKEGPDWTRWKEGDPSNPYFDAGRITKEDMFMVYSTWGVLQNTWWAHAGTTCFTSKIFMGQISVTSMDDPELFALAEAYQNHNTLNTVLNTQFQHPDKVLTGLVMNDEETAISADIGNAIIAYVDECWARFVTGDLDLDKDWDSYIQQIQSIGVEDYRAVLQSSYDRMNAN